MRLSVPTLLFCLLAAACCLPAGAQQQQSSYGFLSLNGRASRQNAVISWETIQELSITRFNIQQSRNGIDFETVGSLEASHDTAQDRYQYSFTDRNAGLHGRVVYYRLAIAINNGRMLYSKTFLLRFDESGEAQLSIQPNVVRSSLPLMVEGTEDGEAELHILDLQGRVMQRRTIQLVKGSSSQSIDISGLRSGSYIAVVCAPGLRLQQRFFHQ
ncbi:MAG: T9SS type A sorting domain-containing protein [Chitinophagaceae bacterium]|nr:MAG: T9SS type A sorting domain-containing protein [Chitinophagaceae bacterium]